ncbi:MAG: amidase family protein, partial [Gemmatimonadota bacterium]|nr:amidase family protein [Gemmatimonadota bacterium]
MFLVLFAGVVLVACEPLPDAADPFDVVEATIAEVHEAMRAGRLTAVELVQAYLDRIETYDKHGPALNTVVTLNEGAPDRAAELDSLFAATGDFVGPLHGIVVVVKDNYDTGDMPTSAGSASLLGSVPPDDAFQVQRVREAGGIVLFKSNMAEFAFSPYETVGSALPGYSRNPYDPTRVTAGSSGGTAAAVAASFGTVGLGTDTGNSIRGPSAHQALVGIRSTMGLTSRDGIVPLYLNRDIGGPMARTVTDAVIVFQVLAGHDPADPVTEAARDRDEVDYLAHLDPEGLRGSRLGVLRALSNREGA